MENFSEKIKPPKMNKILQKAKKQDVSRQIQQIQRFLELENYVFLPSKSKEEYLKCFKLLSKTFLIEFTSFEDKNSKVKSQKVLETPVILQQSESLQEMLRINQKGKLIKSYGGFTRKTNEVVFLLVVRNKYQSEKKSVNSAELKFLFLNDEGRVIHVVSNITQNNIEELFKFITKHFRKLQNLFVVDLTCQLNQAQNITIQLYQSKITKALIYVSPFGLDLEELLGKSDVFFHHYQIFDNKTRCRAISNSNFISLILMENGHQIREIDRNIERLLRFQKIHDFIIQNSFQPQMRKQITNEILFTNFWVINVYSWYFNISLSLEDKLPLESNPMATIKLVNDKIATYFSNKSLSIQQKDYNIGSEKCFPDLLQMPKRCIVCKSCKPKFGCLKCSKKYKTDINLCIEKCFKDFHKSSIKYLQQKFLPKTSESQNPEQKSTSISEKAFFLNLKTENKHKKKESSSRSCVEKNGKSNHPIHRRIMIKKKIKGILKKNPNQLKFIKFKGVKLIDFYQMEGIEMNPVEAEENTDQEQSENINKSEKEIWMQKESSSFTDSLSS